MIKKGDKLECTLDGSGEGYAIYAGEHYIAASDEIYLWDDRITVVELVENGDGEPCTAYETKYFKVI